MPGGSGHQLHTAIRHRRVDLQRNAAGAGCDCVTAAAALWGYECGAGAGFCGLVGWERGLRSLLSIAIILVAAYARIHWATCCFMPRMITKQLHYERTLASKYKAVSHHPVFAAAPALSGEIGKSSDCRQAHALQATTKPRPAMQTPYDCVMKPAAATQHNSKKPMVKMPLDVPPRTCESFPQRKHVAGEARLDQRTARLGTASALHQGHLCMRFRVGAARHAAQTAKRQPVVAFSY